MTAASARRVGVYGTSDNWQSALSGLRAWNASSTVTGDAAWYLHKAQDRLLGWILQYGFGNMFVAAHDVNQLVNDLGEMVAAFGTPTQVQNGGNVIDAPYLPQAGASSLLVSSMRYLETLMADSRIGVALEEDDLNSADYWRGLFALSEARILQVEQQTLTALSSTATAGLGDAFLPRTELGAALGFTVGVGGSSDNYLQALSGLVAWNQGTPVAGGPAFYLHKASSRLRDWMDAYGFGEIFVGRPDAPAFYTELSQMIAAWGSPDQLDPNGGGVITTPWLPGQGASAVLVSGMKQFEYVMGNASVGIALQEDSTDSEDYWHGLFRLSLLKIDAVEESASAQGVTL